MLKKFSLTIRIICLTLIGIAMMQIMVNLGKTGSLELDIFIPSMAVVLLTTFLPEILKRFNIRISNELYIMLLTSMILSMGGGFGFKLYQVLSHYDTVIHFLNGGIILVISFSIIKCFFKDYDKHMIKIIVIAFLASVTIGTLWEIYEFGVDFIFGNNMQRYQDINSGIDFVGQKALLDTMVDLVVDTIGAMLAGFILVRSHFRNKVITNAFNIEIINEQSIELI